ncbi:hypothetical protein CNMCM5793_007962 [Aspergillus hiratsukae]|uniref:CMP/dCMP-type deaminase domain-containing protein n=1 Tax=Aspergillus hiratsukae TaxID=1194566 RepID=A0A8H6P684_9EURO|nr:hypothetical protein CNMCM5793_007962 [Aspergillus hiratsukae]KAF7158482.1 hypothetical protein CNMCM6106_005076 [Aspergillus hiratsukae]
MRPIPTDKRCALSGFTECLNTASLRFFSSLGWLILFHHLHFGAQQLVPRTFMAAAEHVLAIDNEESMELPVLPPNQGFEAFKDIIFGSVAGMAGKVIEYPFDTVKVRLQSQPAHIPLRYQGPLDCFRQSIQADGLRGLYRGISAPMAGAAVENSCLFFSYRIIQDVLKATCYPTADSMPFSALLFSGAASGSITSLALTPIELVKCKMQVPLEASNGKMPGPLTLVAAIFRQDGILGFWRGQMGTLIRETGGGAAWFGGYEGVSAFFRKYRSTPSPRDSESLPIYQQMIAGAAAGISYNFLFYPADTVKSRMQTEDINNAGTHGLTTQELEILSSKAIGAKAKAYCPYSKFRVGACLLTKTGEYIAGANVENAAYPVGSCAERVAFGTAVGQSMPLPLKLRKKSSLTWTGVIQAAGHQDFKAIAVATDITPGASPCGMCRQL